MITIRRSLTLLFAVAALHAGRAEETTVKFSDPKKPGTLKVDVFRGDIRIRGADVAEVTVRADATAVTKAPRKDGMRVLSAASGFSLAEKDNVVTLDNSDGWRGGGGSDYHITVPRNTNIVVSSAGGGGDISCSDISGDIEIDCLHGEVELTGLSGGALVSTLDGEIEAAFVQLSDKKPVSFTSMNGKVELRLPGTAKANLQLRTQNGTILTNFDDTAIVTKVETTSVHISERGMGRTLSREVREALRESAQASTEMVLEAKNAVREATASMRAGIDAARDENRRRSEDVRVEGWTAKSPAPPEAPGAPKPPRPARLSVAKVTSTGGKLVTGTLNGGGPEISVATMNGDVTLRNVDAK